MIHLALALSSQGATDSYSRLIEYGVLGICLIAVAVYYVRKDIRLEKRNQEMSEMERAFRREQAEQQEKFRIEQAEMMEKYRTAMERVSQSLDVVINLLKDKYP